MGFNNAVFLSERETADRNYAMAYYMKEKSLILRDKGISEIKLFQLQHIDFLHMLHKHLLWMLLTTVFTRDK